MKDIKGLLIDLDGVIYNDTKLIAGAKDSIQWLRDNNIPFRFITNTTMKSRATLQQKLTAFNIHVQKEEIFTTVYAAVTYIRKSGKDKCYLLLMDDAKKEFEEFRLDTTDPDFVVVGDLGDDVSFESMNRAFQKLLSGSELLALQKNRYWLSDKGYTLDAGAWVAMLEFAANKKGQIIGKPSPHFFALALSDLNLSPEKVIMVGDDIESDIGGAQRLGINGVLVKTGKFMPSDLERQDIRPWKVIAGIGDLPNIFKSK
jgi:HAD superfamily hydrolase (TIGR01458 family)